MPLYEYECEACGNRFEQIQKFSDPLVETCPKCGKRAVHKLQSSPAFQFKGSGWYITDYAKKDSSAAKSDDAKDAKAASTDTKDTKTGASETKSETPAKKTETAAPTAAGSKEKASSSKDK
jgi:putative FmdB family regulatory protein